MAKVSGTAVEFDERIAGEIEVRRARVGDGESAHHRLARHGRVAEGGVIRRIGGVVAVGDVGSVAADGDLGSREAVGGDLLDERGATVNMAAHRAAADAEMTVAL